LLISGGVTLTILKFAPQIRHFQQYGYPGVFLISLIGNASIALPIPSLAVTFSMGAALNWPLVGLVSGIGEALGETTGYLAGLSGSAVVENKKMYTRMQYWMENHGMLTIFILSMVPNPIIDLAGISAGALRYAYYKFLFSCWAGKTIKTLIFAWAGSHSVEWVMRFFGM
jgi:membrane protein DedA with SNARE-associated domain